MGEKRIVIDFSPRSILWVVFTVIAIWLVYVLREIFVIVFLSYIFATAADPLIDRLEKKKIPRSVSIIGLYLAVVGVLVLFFRLIIPPAISQITDLAQNSDLYIDRINAYVQGINPSFAESAKTAILNFIANLGSTGVLSQALGIFSGALGLLLIFVISFYLLWQRNGVEKVIATYFPQKYQEKTIDISRQISAKMSSWVRGQLFLVFIIFMINYIGLSILGVDFALILAILSGILELLPIIGPIIAGAAAALVALTVSPLLALFVVIWYVVVQQVENHILVPQIMKKSLGLNPITVIIAILIGGKILGVLGIIIAVPVAVSLSIIFRELWQGRESKWI